MADDQQIADFIKARLQAEQQQGNLKGFNVDMRVEQGTVWFTGHVSNSDQEMTILRTAQAAGHLGVVQGTFRSASFSRPSPAPQPQVQAPSYQQPAVPQEIYQQSPYRQASSTPEFVDGGVVGEYGDVIVDNYGGNGGATISNEPMPFATAGGGAPLAYGPSTGTSEAPNLPGYAWPSYAASPNYGAVAYPKQHSASAWPYIGPFYPYPQVPLGWRKVSLEWDDGWWMLDFHDK